MNETMKKALADAQVYVERLKDLAEMIEKSESWAEMHFDMGDARNLCGAADTLQYLAYMCEREAEQLEMIERKTK